MEVEPGGGAVQLPHSGRNTPFTHGFGCAGGCPAPVGAVPHAKSFRMHLTITVAAAAAGAVAHVFGTA